MAGYSDRIVAIIVALVVVGVVLALALAPGPHQTTTTTITKTVTSYATLLPACSTSQPPTTTSATSSGEEALEVTSLGLRPRSLKALVDFIEALSPRVAMKLVAPVLEASRAPATPMPMTVATVTATIASAATTPSLEYSSTNVQVAGVDEHDIVKTNGSLIYVARWDKVMVFRAYPPEKLEKIEEISIGKLLERFMEKTVLQLVEGNKTITIGIVKPSFSIAGLYAYKDKLVILARESRTAYGFWLPQRTWIVLYEPGRGIVNTFKLDGSITDSRLLGSKLIVVAREGTAYGRIIVPLVGDKPIDINKTFIVGRPEAYTIILALDLSTWKHDSLTIVGPTATTMYMTASGDIYLALNAFWVHILPLVRVEAHTTATKIVNVTSLLKEIGNMTVIPWTKTIISKISLENGPKLVPGAYVLVDGRINKQWQIDEYSGVLRVVVEDWSSGKLKISLYTFNATTLKSLGELRGIAVNERVHGVRFMGPRLYLVTFRNIDPLFTIDITNPAEPKVLGFLKGPGFDEYLHPLGKGLLLGIGLEDRRVRLSLYKLLDNGSIIVLDRLKLGGEAEFSWSPVLEPRYGHKAFTYDPRHNYILLPLNIVKVVQIVDENGRITYYKKMEGGVDVIEVHTGEKPSLKEKALLVHQGALRSLYIDDAIYTIAPYPYTRGGEKPIVVKAFNAVTLEQISSAG